MPAGSAPSLAHPLPDSLPSGTFLWHLHPARFGPTAFNPMSANRFAGAAALPPRAMYYAGDSPEIAIWETLLRTVVADKDGTVALFEAQIANWRVAHVKTLVPIEIVDLSMPVLRKHVGNPHELNEWQELQRVSAYARTHTAAAALLLALPRIGGLQWTSKQAGKGAAFVFYDPPAAPMFQAVDDRDVTWADIDSALVQAGIIRVPTDPAILAALP